MAIRQGHCRVRYRVTPVRTRRRNPRSNSLRYALPLPDVSPCGAPPCRSRPRAVLMRERSSWCPGGRGDGRATESAGKRLRCLPPVFCCLCHADSSRLLAQQAQRHLSVRPLRVQLQSRRCAPNCRPRCAAFCPSTRPHPPWCPRAALTSVPMSPRDKLSKAGGRGRRRQRTLQDERRRPSPLASRHLRLGVVSVRVFGWLARSLNYHSPVSVCIDSGVRRSVGWFTFTSWIHSAPAFGVVRT